MNDCCGNTLEVRNVKGNETQIKDKGQAKSSGDQGPAMCKDMNL